MKRTIIYVCLILIILLNSITLGAKVPPAKSVPLPLGVVEGFYGPPWTHEGRLSLIRFMGSQHMNLFIYAPKDDPYHRNKWRDEYPPEQLKKIAELVREAKKNHVNFCYAISPGLDIHYAKPEDFKQLINKLDTMYNLGVRDFALFLDDVSDQLQFPEDKQLFASYGDAHVKITNDLYHSLKEKNPRNTLIFCPTEYYKVVTSPYLETIGKGINREVPIIWTGDGVTSPTMYTDNLMKIRAIFRRKPFIWDNYPCNDYNRNRLYLGPLMQRSAAFPQHISGYAANPMNEAELSKIPLYTIAQFFKDPYNYSPEKSFRDAVKVVGGAKAFTYLYDFCDESRSTFMSNDDSLQSGLEIAAYLENPSAENKTRLMKRFERYSQMKETLSQASVDRMLLKEMSPYLAKLASYGNAGMTSLKNYAIDSVQKDDPDWVLFIRQAKELRAIPQSIADVSMQRLIQGALQKGFRDLGVSQPLITATLPIWEANVLDYAVDGDTTTFYWAPRGGNLDDNITVDYGKMTTAKQIRLYGGSALRPDDFIQNGVVEFSDNGSDWRDAVTIKERDVIISVKSPFRFLKIRFVTPQDKWVMIREISLD